MKGRWRTFAASWAALAKDLMDFRSDEGPAAGRKAFQLPPSLARMMRLGDYDTDKQLFTLIDGRTPVAMYEIKGFPTEGATQEDFEDFEQKIFQILAVFPRLQQKNNPWTVQLYVKDEHDLRHDLDEVSAAVHPRTGNCRLTTTYLRMFREHCDLVTRKGGLYTDPHTGNIFSGKRRVARLVFYRKAPKVPVARLHKEMRQLRQNIETQLGILSAYGVRYQRMSEKALFLWLFHKFHLTISGFDSPAAYLQHYPFVPEQERLFGYDIIERALAEPVYSNDKAGWWRVGNTYHQYISALGLRQAPAIGAITAERLIAKNYQAWLDAQPLGTEFHMTFNPVSEHDLSLAIERKMKAARKSTAADADKTIEEVNHFKAEMVDKNFLYPAQVGCFIAAESEEQLEIVHDKVAANMGRLSLEVLHPDYDIERLDKWFRFLPGNYDPGFDQAYYTAKLTAVRHIARLAPFGYGRASGAQVPLYVNFNRNGEPVYENPYTEKVNNRHKITLGSTGSGKSVRIGSELVSLMAMIRPYLVVVDAGKSFEFLVEFLSSQGLSVRKIVIEQTKGLPAISLNPYLDTGAFVAEHHRMEVLNQQVRESIEAAIAATIDKVGGGTARAAPANGHRTPSADSSADEAADEAVQRDYMAEFLTAGLIIAGNGRDAEEAGLTDLHKRDLLEVTLYCAQQVLARGRDQLLPSDVRDELEKRAQSHIHSSNELTRAQGKRYHDLFAGFDTFLQSSINRMYFDTPAQRFTDVDLTYFELGLFKDDKPSNIAPRALAVNSLISQTMTLCEARQHFDRNTVFFMDECHIITTKTITAMALVQCAKMARKIGLDLKLATQDPEDFAGVVAKMLASFEHFEILDFNSDEARRKIAQLIGLSERELEMARSIRNAPGYHSESVLINKTFRLLTRCIPIREVLFMCMNNPDEKSRRREIAQACQCTAVEASFLQAQQLKHGYRDLVQVREMLGEADDATTSFR